MKATALIATYLGYPLKGISISVLMDSKKIALIKLYLHAGIFGIGMKSHHTANPLWKKVSLPTCRTFLFEMGGDRDLKPNKSESPRLFLLTPRRYFYTHSSSTPGQNRILG